MMFGKYTMVLKTIMDDPESRAVLDKALSEYPLHTPKNPPNHMIIPTREEINQKLLDHYKYREIGFETFGRFVDELRIAMNEIMPYYNQMFNSEDIINGLEDIFGNLDVKEEYEETSEGGSESNSKENISGSENSSSDTKSKSSDNTTTETDMAVYDKLVDADTPQSKLDISAQNINDMKYASSMKLNKNESDGTTKTTGSTNNTTDVSAERKHEQENTAEQKTSTTGKTTHTLTRKGNQGVNTYAHDMNEFRELFQNIVQQIITDKNIECLFMQVF